MYVVFEVYYKYGEYSVVSLGSTSELVAYLEKFIAEHTGDRSYESIDCTKLEEKGEEDLESLIQQALSVGSDVIKGQQGYGIVSVVKGEEM